MSQMINMNSVKKYYLGYHQDGLLDIFLALGMLFSVVALSFGTWWLATILPALFWPLWISAKEIITAPRLAGLRVSREQVSQGRTAILGLTIVGVVAFLLGIVMFMLFSFDRAPMGLTNWLRENFLSVMGVISGFILALTALLGRIPRYYTYALLAVLVGVGGPLLNIKPSLYTATFSLIMLLSGIVVLLRFTRTHPS